MSTDTDTDTAPAAPPPDDPAAPLEAQVEAVARHMAHHRLPVDDCDPIVCACRGVHCGLTVGDLRKAVAAIRESRAEVARLRAERDAHAAVVERLIAANGDRGLSYCKCDAAYDLACAVSNAIAIPGATPAAIRKAAGLAGGSEDKS